MLYGKRLVMNRLARSDVESVKSFPAVGQYRLELRN